MKTKEPTRRNKRCCGEINTRLAHEMNNCRPDFTADT
jgi:hypothetical protein